MPTPICESDVKKQMEVLNDTLTVLPDTRSRLLTCAALELVPVCWLGFICFCIECRFCIRDRVTSVTVA